MKAERLHAALKAIVNSAAETKAVKLVSRLKSVTETVNTSPTAENIQTVRTTFEEFITQMNNSSVNMASPTQMAIYEAIGATDYMGKGLVERVRNILNETHMTPIVRAQQLQKLIEEMQRFFEVINRVLSDFAILKVEIEDLQDEQAEMGISIPRSAFPPTVQDFEKEFKRLKFILDTFNEIATNNQEPVEIKSISSSDWQFYLVCGLQVLILLPEAIDKIIGLLNKYLDFKKKISDLESAKFPAESIKPLTEYLEKFLPDERRRIAEELVQAHGAKGIEAGRRQELQNKLSIALSHLIEIMAKGGQFEVRVKLPPAPPADAPEAVEAYENRVQLLKKVSEQSVKLRSLSIQDKTISLPPPEDIQ